MQGGTLSRFYKREVEQGGQHQVEDLQKTPRTDPPVTRYPLTIGGVVHGRIATVSGRDRKPKRYMM
ncbi:hypothetical protein PO124_12700 [Bacillus licheniformis]|nr:hypothetical protein [Bacillus licheniformis]